MLNKLKARQRALRLGAGLLGASVLAVGFASPAFATSSSGGNAASANYNIYVGGSNTTYLMMTSLSDLFNESPGCDLASLSGTSQPLDYGCPGLNDPGTSLSHPIDTVEPGSTVNTSSTITVSNVSPNTGTTGFLANDAVSDSAGAIPNHAIIVSVVNATTFTINKPATATAGSDTITVATTPAVGENGFTTFNNENPFNDLLIQEPPLGSSNGILELEDQGTHASGASSDGSPINVSPLDAARSSRAPNLTASGSVGDDKGLNFVAYAMDAVDWLHWTSVKGTATPSAAVKNLTVGQLTSIYNDDGCTSPGGTTYTTPNWACYGGNPGAIALYIAQNGSGTESTWQTLLNLTAGGAKFPFGGEDANHIIFENETSSILNNGDEANAIFFFSYGKYQTICTPNPSFCSGASTSKTALGQINSVKVKAASIKAQLPGASGVPFPGDRLLYNVYSDGSNADIPASSTASLNALSEDGFLCKPATTTDIDPNTGVAYRTEIDSIITAQGFTPLPLMVENGEGVNSGFNGGGYGTTASGIPSPAWSTGGLSASAYNAANETVAPYTFPAADTDTDNSAVSGSYTGVYNDGTTGNATASAKNPVGYCLTMTTDGNSTN